LPRIAGALRRIVLVGAIVGFFTPALAQSPAPPPAAAESVAVDAPVAKGAATAPAAGPLIRVAILPIRIHSARSLGPLTESLGQLIATRLEAREPNVVVVDSGPIRAAMGSTPGDLSDAELRKIADRAGVRAVVTGSLTELAGRFSLDLRVTPSSSDLRSQTIVITAESEEELQGHLDELIDRVAGVLSGATAGHIKTVFIVGAGDLEEELGALLDSKTGEVYSSQIARRDRERIEARSDIATVSISVQRTADGVELIFAVNPTGQLYGDRVKEAAGEKIEAIRIEGNRRIETDAIRARIKTKVGEAIDRAKLADDVKNVYGLGFFGHVTVTKSQGKEGVILTFQVEENPVVRQISIIGNESVESEKIREALSLTTGSTLDYPLLFENQERIEALYRAEGYYLASVRYTVDPLSEGSVAINFDVRENEKLRLTKIIFDGNAAFSDEELESGFATKRWRFWSYATSWYDKSGTYSEPVFLRDLRSVEKLYTDDGYLQVEVGEPIVDPAQDGLTVTVPIREGPQFHVGKIDVEGDRTVDLVALREFLNLESGEIFNRSHLTEDVEELERFYTDRGFYFASVQPDTQLSQADDTVDITFRVKKGPLYFIRKINVSGNTRTVDHVIRREMRVTEGELYSARSLRLSDVRVRNLNFFEDVSFEPKPTEDPSQLDLDVTVVERPTGSFSFGAGYSSQDSIVLTVSLAQSNLLGRGYGVNLTADFGPTKQGTNRFYISFTDPYFLGSQFSFGSTFYLTELRYQDFSQSQYGADISFGHSLSEDNRIRGFIRYSLSSREIEKDSSSLGAATIIRELQAGGEVTSLLGLSVRSDTRDDRFAPTSGFNWGATLEYAGIGGFTKFLRAEARFAAYLGAPSWLFERSTFVVSTRIGYTIPFNDVSDFGAPVLSGGCLTLGCGSEIQPLNAIDTDLKLPLTERYFLGGIGSFQLRGFEARSVGPRRSLLFQDLRTGNEYFPFGRQVRLDASGRYVADCVNSAGVSTPGKCNSLTDKRDFAQIDYTDVVGGSSFISSSFEYRFPVSQELGLLAILFVDMGNAFAENENLFDVREWRFGTGAGLLWFSPFGPLQVVLGFPLDPLSIEKSPVFEFSVGGVGL